MQGRNLVYVFLLILELPVFGLHNVWLASLVRNAKGKPNQFLHNAAYNIVFRIVLSTH